jgi:hypothetical protein
LGDLSTTLDKRQALRRREGQIPTWASAVALLIWMLAAAVAFLPFAFNTSPWDAVTLRVPGNQGNWWHFLAGLPFFLAFPMIWVRLCSLFSTQPLTATERRSIWIVVGFSIAGTTLVLAPFLLHLAGTSEWQRLLVLSLAFGIVIVSSVVLLLRRHQVFPDRACLVALDTAYLANAALCLVVYSDAIGTLWSRSGWIVSLVIFWPIAFELVWLLTLTLRGKASVLPAQAP